jgi:hypothetical protein
VLRTSGLDCARLSGSVRRNAELARFTRGAAPATSATRRRAAIRSRTRHL